MIMKKLLVYILAIISLSVSAQQHYRAFPIRSINTDANEMAPVIYKNGIVFSSNKKNSVVMVTTDQDNNYQYNLYFAAKKKGKNFEKPKLLSPEITSKLSESSATFSPDFQSMFITRSHMAGYSISQIQKADTIRNGIYECEPYGEGDEWRVSEGFFFNDPAYDVAFPTLSKDGTKMFFASRAPGGYGGYDLYVTEKKGVSWSDPENLGPTINTDENEVFPFYHDNGRLYFSSRGHNTQGKLDIFYSEKRKGEWITPINLPRPFNSRHNDFGYVLSTQMDTGYFVRSRVGQDDDIWMFTSGFPRFESCEEQKDETFCYRFSEQGSMDLDTTSLKYEWEFGDGQKERSIDARHCYSEVGSYQVSLNVIDTLTGEVYFSEASYELVIEPLEQAYITVRDTVFVDEKIKLDGHLSEIRSFEPKEYFWDFGDGAIETLIETEHSYTSPGVYYIRLGITDGEELEDDDEVLTGRTCSQKQIVVLEVEK